LYIVLKSKFRNLFLAFGILAVIIMLFTFDVSYDELLDNLRRAGFYLPLVLVLWLFIYLINTLSWYIILRSSGPVNSLSFARLYKFTVSGFALNYVTPVGLMGGEPYRIMELTPYVGVERATSSVILYVMMHIFSHFCFWLSSVLIYVFFYPVGWGMGIVLGLTTLFCLLLVTLFIKGYRNGMAVACIRLGSHIPFLKKHAVRFAELHKEKLETIDSQIALLHQQRKSTFYSALGLCGSLIRIYSPRHQLPGDLVDSECIDYGCQFCRLYSDRRFLFPTGQSAFLSSHAIRGQGRRFCPGGSRFVLIRSIWGICRSDYAGAGDGLDCYRAGADEDRKSEIE
jgi:hypothetical protein